MLRTVFNYKFTRTTIVVITLKCVYVFGMWIKYPSYSYLFYYVIKGCCKGISRCRSNKTPDSQGKDENGRQQTKNNRRMSLKSVSSQDIRLYSNQKTGTCTLSIIVDIVLYLYIVWYYVSCWNYVGNMWFDISIFFP